MSCYRVQKCVRALCLVIAMVTLLPGCGDPTPVLTGQHPYEFAHVGDSASPNLRLNYLLHLPPAYGSNPLKRWPLLIFLHGSGEAGSTLEDLERLKVHGPPRLLDQAPPLPELADNFIVISPQSPDSMFWNTQFAALDALLDEIEATYAVDPQRVYLTGISLGGFGTWQYAVRHPDRFAALVPIAGGYGYSFSNSAGYGASDMQLVFTRTIPDTLCTLRDIPVRVFHGALDAGIPHEETAQVVVEAFRDCGGDVTYTLYPDAGHDAWTETYADPDLYTWLLKQRKD